jgi:hypothetical protein
MSDKLRCSVCDKELSTLGKLNQHLLSFHGIDKRKANISCREDNCNFKCGILNNLINHLEKEHKKEFEFERISFKTIEGKNFKISLFDYILLS